jgi:hypothetical protein
MPPYIGGKPKPVKAEGHEPQQGAVRDEEAKLAILAGESRASARGRAGHTSLVHAKSHTQKRTAVCRGGNQKQLNYSPKVFSFRIYSDAPIARIDFHETSSSTPLVQGTPALQFPALVPKSHGFINPRGSRTLVATA